MDYRLDQKGKYETTQVSKCTSRSRRLRQLRAGGVHQ